ncbi:hypothetical protein JHK82_039517 [Glycine max]|nr:hypothetical protein JHK86_039704 [Glycine max]KAG4965306.1 hypothetical protein JHK85_040281 [Glycine max]KAG5110294.1 hypothetical protein JHK82_039517 [Glycine max]KAG5121581.1 hypothetical protein JHK84_039921 [Glycine max]
MASINESVPALVYYDAYVADCDEGVEFKGENNVLVLMRRGTTLNALKTKIQRKMGLNRGQTITAIIYRYPIFVGSSMFNYQAVTISDDVDIDGMFDIYNQHQCLSSFQLLVQYKQQPSSTPMSKQPFNHHKFTKHHTLTTILKPTMKANPLTHQSHTRPQMVITSLILNPPNSIPTLVHTHNCLVDHQTTSESNEMSHEYHAQNGVSDEVVGDFSDDED